MDPKMDKRGHPVPLHFAESPVVRALAGAHGGPRTHHRATRLRSTGHVLKMMVLHRFYMQNWKIRVPNMDPKMDKRGHPVPLHFAESPVVRALAGAQVVQSQACRNQPKMDSQDSIVMTVFSGQHCYDSILRTADSILRTALLGQYSQDSIVKTVFSGQHC